MMGLLLNFVSLVILIGCGWQEGKANDNLVGKVRISKPNPKTARGQRQGRMHPLSLSEGSCDHRFWMSHW